MSTQSSYFANFPLTTYNGITIQNIFLRVKFIESLKLNSVIYYPYTVAENETADDIANWYYGAPQYDWIIYLTNNIIDPYGQWPKSEIQFENYITSKYGSVSEAQSQIIFYRKNADVFYLSPDGTQLSPTYQVGYQIIANNDDIRITIESYNAISDQSNYYPVYAYDYEYEENENKRSIQLLDYEYRDDIVQQLSGLLNG